MRRLARAGIPILSYSFMWGETFRDYFMNFLESRPLFDWVRTDLSVPWRDGSTALALDMVAQWITIQKSILIFKFQLVFFLGIFNGFSSRQKSKERESWKGNPKPFEESLFSLTQERLSSHKFIKNCLLLKKNKRVCKKTIFPFGQILWVCWLAVHPIEIGEKRRAKVFKFFTKPLLLLWLYF